MMNYKEFCQEAEARMKEFLPERYQDAEVQMVTAMKNNDVERVGISVREENEFATPTIYLEEFYEHYQENESVEQTFMELAKAFKEAKQIKAPSMSFDLMDFDSMKDKINCKLVNFKGNTKALLDMPFTKVENLAEVYMIDFGTMEGDFASIKVSNKMQEKWGVSTQELHQIAMENGPFLSPPTLTDMRDTIDSLMGVIEPGETKNLLVEGKSYGGDMYVLTNVDKHFGAATVLYPGVLEKVAEAIGEDYYLLPSSVHECLVVPKSVNPTPKELGEMVRDVNAEQVEKEERLADCVFEFTKGEKGFKVVPESVKQKEVEMER